MTEFKEVSTAEVLKAQKSGSRIIDVRPVDAYNGWKLHNEVRGGDIKGAKSLPVKWTTYMDWIEIVRHKGIEPREEIIIYGDTPEEAQKVAETFAKADYPKIAIYKGFLEEWAKDDSLPMDHLPNYRHLVSAQWLKQLIEGESPAEYDNNKFVLVHAHYRNGD